MTLLALGVLLMKQDTQVTFTLQPQTSPAHPLPRPPALCTPLLSDRLLL